jgi:transcriptional adapter 2-alpha
LRSFLRILLQDQTKTPIFDPDWGADEEKNLIDGLKKHGMGNWEDLAEIMGGPRTKAEIEQHYYQVYLDSPTAPLPDMTVPLPFSNDHSRESGMRATAALAESKRGKSNKNKASNSSTTHAKQTGPTAPKPKNLALAHLVGYLPRRGDFDTEYEDNAEEILADMEFKVEDSSFEKTLKLKVLEIYNSKLAQRLERKEFILSRGLLEKRTEKRTKSEREAYNNMRVFARFHSATEHEAFINGLINEQRLRKRIEQLQNYRMNGIRSLADAHEYEKRKVKKETHKNKPASFLFDKDTVVPRKPSSKRPSDGSEEPEPSPTKTRRTGSWMASGIDISHINAMEGADRLSDAEKHLVCELELPPLHYLEIKERLVKEGVLRGLFKPGQSRQLFKVDINKSEKILDFFVSLGWLIATPASARHDAAASAAEPGSEVSCTYNQAGGSAAWSNSSGQGFDHNAANGDYYGRQKREERVGDDSEGSDDDEGVGCGDDEHYPSLVGPELEKALQQAGIPQAEAEKMVKQHSRS